MADEIRVEVSERIATVTFDRPEKLNPLTPATMARLRDIVAELEADDAVRVLILTGAGRAFSAGGERGFLGEVTRMTPVQIRETVYASFAAGVKAVKLCRKPTIAAVNGIAMGAGCELTIACDFRIAGERAVFHENWVNLGILAPLGGMFLLPRIVGLNAASEMLLLGRRVDATEALRIGLVREVVPDDALPEAARELARQLAEGAPLAQAAVKEGLRRGMESTLAAEWDFNVYAQAMLLSSGDFAEAVAALNEKRPPRFSGK